MTSELVQLQAPAITGALLHRKSVSGLAGASTSTSGPLAVPLNVGVGLLV